MEPWLVRAVNSAVGTCSNLKARLQLSELLCSLCPFLRSSCQFPLVLCTLTNKRRHKQKFKKELKTITYRAEACCLMTKFFLIHLRRSLFVLEWDCNTVFKFFPAGYDVQSASTQKGVLYISGAPRYNHTGRVVIYRIKEGKIVVSQILKGKQVNVFNRLHNE